MKQETEAEGFARPDAAEREQDHERSSEMSSPASRIPGLSKLPEKRPPRRAFGLLRGRRKP